MNKKCGGFVNPYLEESPCRLIPNFYSPIMINVQPCSMLCNLCS